MNNRHQSFARIRAIIRWATGAIVASTIMIIACYLFSLFSSLPALALTGSLSLFIGLNIALPPLDPEDDWVSIHPRMKKDAIAIEAVDRPSQKETQRDQKKVDSVEGIEILPVHHRRMMGSPSGLLSVFHPEIKHDEETHRITVGDRHGHKRVHLHELQSPSAKKKG